MINRCNKRLYDIFRIKTDHCMNNIIEIIVYKYTIIVSTVILNKTLKIWKFIYFFFVHSCKLIAAHCIAINLAKNKNFVDIILY